MVETIIKTMNNAPDMAEFVDGDYYKPYFDDDPDLKVIMCGVCGKPKECYPFMATEFGNTGKPTKDKRIYPFGKPVKLACQCDCQVDKAKQAEKKTQREKASIQRKIDCWGYVDEQGQKHRNLVTEKISFNNYDVKDNKHIKACKKYISTISQRLDDGKGLFLCGKSGAGKTFASMCFANAVMDRMFRCYFKEQWQIQSLSQFDNSDEIKQLESCTFLVIDDFNPDTLNDYGREVMLNLFDTRIKRGLPTIFTSNMTKRCIENPPKSINIRFMDRIIQNCHIIEDSTNNYRRN